MDYENQYKLLLSGIELNGSLSDNRTGVKTKKQFNKSLNIDLKDGFPILTGKKVFFSKALGEFLWMYNGDTTVEFLHKYGIFWWDDFADKDGNIGKSYGYQLRKWQGSFDQWKYAKKELKKKSRRAVITLWNPADLNGQLPSCYTTFNFVIEDNRLNLVVHFRSSDVFLGLPYDVCVTALFLHQMAIELDMEPGTLGINLADAHVYENHSEQIEEYLMRPHHKLPGLIYDEKYSLLNYQSGEYIKAKLNV